MFSWSNVLLSILETKIRPDSCTKCKKKEADLKRSASFSFMSTGNYSATEMQSVGQTSAHDPQSVQRSASIL